MIPTREMIERCLDTHIVEIIIEPTQNKIKDFGSMVKILNNKGYLSNRDYLEIYEELKEEYIGSK